LIVDDEPFNLIVLEALLNEFGVTKIDRAHNGREALEIIEKNIQQP
jgi:CheY-like chemotaxis protein